MHSSHTVCHVCSSSLGPRRPPSYPTLSSIDLFERLIDLLCLHQGRKLEERMDNSIEKKPKRGIEKEHDQSQVTCDHSKHGDTDEMSLLKAKNSPKKDILVTI